METRILEANDEAIQLAAELLRAGDVVAFPTETVYGLGANALDADAVEKIFIAKGRPSNNPLIVHVASVEQAKSLVTDWPDSAEILASALWPGPLTLVLPKADTVPGITTAGGNTVGIRFPVHAVAQALIKECGFPLAAPSANRSNYISPTTAEHVLRSLDGRIPLVLDGGPCDGGIESTVLDLSKDEIRILRPGLFSVNFISGLLGKKVHFERTSANPEIPALPSPGQLQTHYSPHTPFYLTSINEWKQMLDDLIAGSMQNRRVGLMVFDNTELSVRPEFIHIKRMPRNHEDYARILFSTLHELDSLKLESIYCEMPPDTPDWAGVHDRLNRASHKKK